MAGDGRVSRIGQAKGHEAAARRLGLRIGRHLREKAVHNALRHLFAGERHRAAAAHQAGGAAQQGDGGLRRCVGRQQQLLGGAAAVHQLRQPAGRERARRLTPRQAGLGRMRQRQVHVVAAQHQMVAHAQAGQPGLAVDQFHLDQAEVGGAAAHIADQHQPGLRQFLGELAAMAQQPVVKHRLRLFQQAQPGQAGLARGGQGQGAGAFIKGGRHRQHQLLLRQRMLWKARVPGRVHVTQIAGAGLDRRHLGHLVGRAPGQYGGLAVHRRMRQPALGAGHQPARHLRAQLARQLAQHHGRLAGLGRPGQLQRGVGQFAGRGVVAHRGQQRQRGDFTGRDQLRHVEQPDFGRLRVCRGRQRRIGDDGVGGAQVYADDVLAHQNPCLRPSGRARRTPPSSVRRPGLPRPSVPRCRFRWRGRAA